MIYSQPRSSPARLVVSLVAILGSDARKKLAARLGRNVRAALAALALVVLPAVIGTAAAQTPSMLDEPVSQTSAGQDHTCALTTAGAVKCWGRNDFGQLGDGTTTQKSAPVNVPGLVNGVAAISAGAIHTCALTTTGAVKCWGYNAFNQLGDGTTTQRVTPVNVSGLVNGVAAISAGGFHTCALTTTGAVKCWGFNVYGQIGDGTKTDRSAPVDIGSLGSGVAAISAGAVHTCALTTTGAVKCWGFNLNGQLGNGDMAQQSAPVDVVGLSSGVAAISAGGAHTCALTTAGGAKCWGHNGFSEIGDNSTTDRLTPVDVVGFSSGVAAISAGQNHTCALTTVGAVKCWGRNDQGQLGNGGTTDRSTS